MSGIRLVIDEFRADVTKTRNYPDCLVMPTWSARLRFWVLVRGCRWWAGRDKPKLVRLRIREAVGPRDPNDLEDAEASVAGSDLNRSLYRSAATASSPEQEPRNAARVVQTHLLWNGRGPLWATFPVASEWTWRGLRSRQHSTGMRL
jgi:hypothetical protein